MGGFTGRKRSKNVFSYAAFSKDKLRELQAERPTASADELKDEIKAAWQALTAAEKKPYRNRNADDDDLSTGVGAATGTPKSKKPRQRGAVSAYNVFTKQTLAKLRAAHDDPHGALVKYTSQMCGNSDIVLGAASHAFLSSIPPPPARAA